MNISYEHANPQAGNESFVIRVHETQQEATPCILVDAGGGVDIDDVLDDGEYLTAILLTHAHLDHYQSLDDAHRDAAPILTSPGTAAILEDVLDEGARQYGLSNTDALLERVEAISDWQNILGETVSVRPVPAGHATGACGFRIDIVDGDNRVRLLVTGDFTERDAAQYPGFEPDAYTDVDVLFLTAATNDSQEEALTEIVGTVVERTNAGSKTLCTASGLTGVHLAVLLSGVHDKLDVNVPVILAGQVAKLYDALGYEHEAIETVPTFSATSECLEHGTVTIAGPEVPVEGASGRLFDAIAEDPSASLVQVQGGNTTAKTGSDAAGTVSAYEFSNHPTESVLDHVAETISPTHIVVTHQRERALKRYKEKWDSFTWATGSRGQEVLYRDGEYRAPPWVSDYVKQRVRNRDGQLDTARVDNPVLEAAESIPSLNRHNSLNLAREGVDLDALKDRLHVTTTAPQQAQQTAEQTRTVSATDGGLYRTTGGRLPTDTPAVEASAEDSLGNSSGLIDTVEAATARKATQRASGTAEDTTSSETAETKETAQPERDKDDVTSEPETASTAGNADSTEITAATEQATLVAEIDPAVRQLAQLQADDKDVSLAVYARDAVDDYLADILRGSPPSDTEPISRSFTFDADPALAELLSLAAAEDGAESTDAFALEALTRAFDFDNENTVSVLSRGALERHLDALVENNTTRFETRDEIVQASLEHRLGLCEQNQH